MRIVFDNQRKLAEANEHLDVQMAVLSRLVVVRTNQMIENVNKLLRVTASGSPIDPVTAVDIKELFAAFHALRRRKDFREYEEKWYAGESLANLPPEHTEPEGAFIFGGETHGQAHTPSGEDAVPALPTVQGTDHPPAEPVDAA